MHRLWIIVCLLSCFLILASASEVKKRPVVKTTTGRVQGFVQEVLSKRIRTFLGIPFAEPPVGDLRFARPVPIKPWKGKKQVTTPHNSCFQFQDLYENWGEELKLSDKYDLTTKVSEDCLYLNVFTPEDAKGLPTVVLIHGGGFVAGAASMKLVDGTINPSFANTIIVSINYRLGPFGFLFLNNTESPGNQGLLDQVLALQWVHDNIEAFGGDKNKIAIEGVSAGGASVGYHLISPLSKGLFSSAIMQSGAPNEWKDNWCYENPEDALVVSTSIAAALGCVDDNIVDMSCMREGNASTINILQYTVPKPSGMPGRGMIPTLDGEFLTSSPESAIDEANVEIPLMVSLTKDEGTMFHLTTGLKLLPTNHDPNCSDTQYAAVIREFYVDEVIRQIVAHSYSEFPYGDEQCIKALSDFYSDYYFVCPSLELAVRWSDRGGHVYWYTFDHRPVSNLWPEWCGVAHGDDMEFTFGTPLINTVGFTDYERTISKSLMTYFHNFAKTGDPNEGGAVDTAWWPEFTTEERMYLNIGDEFQVKQGGAMTKRCDLLSKTVPEIQSMIDSKNCPPLGRTLG